MAGLPGDVAVEDAAANELAQDGVVRDELRPLQRLDPAQERQQSLRLDVVRRVALDLQQLVHSDMRRHFSLYPKKWGLKKTDRNIDHRRVPNLQKYFSRHAKQLKIASDTGAFAPGDIVTCTLPGNLPHIMLVSDKKSPAGTPLVIHNIGQGTREEDCLMMFPLTGHYRLR